MKVLSTLILVTALCSVGCEDSRESVMDDMAGLMEQTLDVVEGVKTEADAKAAVPRLEDIKAQAAELGARAKAMAESQVGATDFEDMKNMSPEEMMEKGKAMAEKAKKDMEELKPIMDRLLAAGQKLDKEQTRIMNDPKLREHLGKVLRETANAFDANP